MLRSGNNIVLGRSREKTCDLLKMIKFSGTGRDPPSTKNQPKMSLEKPCPPSAAEKLVTLSRFCTSFSGATLCATHLLTGSPSPAPTITQRRITSLRHTLIQRAAANGGRGCLGVAARWHAAAIGATLGRMRGGGVGAGCSSMWCARKNVYPFIYA